MNTEGLTHRRRYAILANLIATCVALSFLSTALYTALPAIAKDLSIALADAQWISSGYTLAMAIATPFTAFLASRFPTKPLYVTAVCCFLAGTLLCGIASNFALIMVTRVVQAAANAMLANLTQVTILTVFPKGKQGSAMGWFGLAVGAAPVIAPTLGGLLTDTLGWRSIFYVVATIAALSLMASFFTMKNVLKTTPTHFDLLSFILSALVFGGFSLGLGNLAGKGIASPLAWIPLAVGIISAIPFTLRQLKSKQPFLKLQLLGLRDFRMSVIANVLLYMVMMGASSVIALYAQQDAGTTATTAGIMVLPGALCYALASPVAGKIFDRHGMRALAIVSSALLLLGCAGMLLVNGNTPLWIAASLHTVRCIGIGCLLMPMTTWGNTSVPAPDMPHGSALITSLRNIGGAVGTALFVGIMQSLGTFASFAGMGIVALMMLALSMRIHKSPVSPLE